MDFKELIDVHLVTMPSTHTRFPRYFDVTLRGVRCLSPKLEQTIRNHKHQRENMHQTNFRKQGDGKKTEKKTPQIHVLYIDSF